MKSRPHPYFWKWKIKVQKIKLSVVWGMLKIKNKNGTRDENSSAQRVFKKNLEL